MKRRPFAIPATLAVTVLGLSSTGCTGPSNEDCESACTAMNARRLDGCHATNQNGSTVCVDDSSATAPCSYAVVTTTSTGACCCQPAV